MKVSEKSNGAVQGTEESKEEATLTFPSSGAIGNAANNPRAGEEKTKAGNKDVKPADQGEEVGKPNEAPKPALNLEATLKVVDDLHRRSIQRDNLLNRIHQLETFEITLMEEGDELESNHFRGCQLIISDDIVTHYFLSNSVPLVRISGTFCSHLYTFTIDSDSQTDRGVSIGMHFVRFS